MASTPPVPGWLRVPEDPNALSPQVWPERAHRDADGRLVVGGASATELAERFGTPLYVVDEADARARAARILAAFELAAASVGTDVTVYYAGKAFLSGAIVRWVTEAGLAVDVCTGGELAVALAAGADPGRIGFHGNNKSVAEIERAVGVGVGAIIIDSEVEIERVADAAARAGRVQRVRLRVNSGVHASTHEFLATAHEDQKFGVSARARGRARHAHPHARLSRFPRAALPHRLADLRLDRVRRVRRAPARRARRARERESRARAEPRRRIRHRLHVSRRPHAHRGDRPRHRKRRRRCVPRPRRARAEARVRTRPLDHRPRRYHALHRGHREARADRGRLAPLRLGRRRHERQRAHRALRRRLLRRASPHASRKPRPRSCASPASTASRATSSSTPTTCPTTSRPATCSPSPRPAPTAGRSRRNYNHVPRPPVVAVRDGVARVIVRGETEADLLARDAGLEASVTTGAAEGTPA